MSAPHIRAKYPTPGEQACAALPKTERRLQEALRALEAERAHVVEIKRQLSRSRADVDSEKNSHRETLENVALVYRALGGDLCPCCAGDGAETLEMVEMRAAGGGAPGYRQREYAQPGDRIDDMCGKCEGIGYLPPKMGGRA